MTALLVWHFLETDQTAVLGQFECVSWRSHISSEVTERQMNERESKIWDTAAAALNNYPFSPHKHLHGKTSCCKYSVYSIIQLPVGT